MTTVPGLAQAVGESKELEEAMKHWCRAMEDALGGLSRDEMPDHIQRRFALLAGKEVHHV